MTSKRVYPDAKIIRGAMFGTGQIAQYHLNAWSKIPNVKIVALANRTVEKAYAIAERFGINPEHVYADYKELLDKEKLDFVDIATAPHIHYGQVVESAKHGLHIFCQKPFATNLEEAKRMMAAADQAGVLFSINENWRWRSWYRGIKDLLVKGVVGNPLYFRIEKRYLATLAKKDKEIPPLILKQPYTTDLDHLIVYEWGIHLLDVIRFLFGEISSVYARMQRVSPLFRGEDRSIIVAVADKVDCVVDISWASLGERPRFSQLEYVVIEGDQGSIELLPHKGDLLRITTRQGVVEKPAFTVTPSQAYQASYDDTHRHFIESLRAGIDPETVAADNYKTLEAVFAAYRSYETNQVVYLGRDQDHE